MISNTYDKYIIVVFQISNTDKETYLFSFFFRYRRMSRYVILDSAGLIFVRIVSVSNNMGWNRVSATIKMTFCDSPNLKLFPQYLFIYLHH